jgi:hypothetical protein
MSARLGQLQIDVQLNVGGTWMNIKVLLDCHNQLVERLANGCSLINFPAGYGGTRCFR